MSEICKNTSHRKIMSLDPFVFKRDTFVSLNRLKCVRKSGDVYAFVVNTQKSPKRVYTNKLYVPGRKEPLIHFEMINVGYGSSLIRFLGNDNFCIRHVGDDALVTLIIKSSSIEKMLDSKIAMVLTETIDQGDDHYSINDDLD